MLRIFKWRITSLIRLRKMGIYLSYLAITILGIALAMGLYSPTPQKAFNEFKNLDTIFIAAGGMIGTMLALVFSLSIIPIQRSVETFSPSITRLYINDRTTQFIFITLAAFCLVSFIMAINGAIFGLQSPTLLPLEIIVVAISLDMLRWHHRRVSRLLEPRKAILQLTQTVKGYIDRIQKNISRLAKIQLHSLSVDERGNHSQEQLESSFYASSSAHYTLIKQRVGELTEIAHKAIAKNETHVAEIAISSLVEVGCHYLDCRKNNLVVYPSPDAPLVFESDVNTVLTPIYEHLTDINRNAVALKAETTCIHVVKALGAIAIHTANLKARNFQDYSAPLTFRPLAYIKECVETAQRNGLHDVALQGSHMLLKTSLNAPVNVQQTDVHIPVVEGLQNIALIFLAVGKGFLANEALKDMMAISHHLLKQKHFQLIDVVGEILENLEVLAPLAIAHERTFGSPVIGLPLSPPYDISNSLSIGYLVSEAISLIERDEARKWLNPYREFMELNKIIYHHFRNLAEKVQFEGSFLLWHITQTIKHITRVYLEVLRKSITDNVGHNEELVQQVPWYLAFFWVVFSKAKTIKHTSAIEACDVLAWLGMSFYDDGYVDIAKQSASNIASVTNSFCKIIKNPNPYDVADLLVFIWHIRLLAESKGDTNLTTILDEKTVKPEDLTVEQWQEVQDALKTRKNQLKENLSERPTLFRAENATGLLRQLLPGIKEDIIELSPMSSKEGQILKGRYIIWVDDMGLVGTEGIEKEFQKLGVSLTIVTNTKAAKRKIKERKPDLIISDIGRGENHDAGLRMAEEFHQSGLFRGPYYFYAGDVGHGRIGRASQIGAIIITEPDILIKEVKEKLQLLSRNE